MSSDLFITPASSKDSAYAIDPMISFSARTESTSIELENLLASADTD